jgi:hypothetical protein
MTEAISATASGVTGRLKPLTERILAALPGPRVLWIVAWALVPWVNAGINLLLEPEARSAVWEQGRLLVVLNYVALSLAMVITLWGTARIARRLETLRASTSTVLEVDARAPFRGVNSVLGPLLAVAATATAFALSALLGAGSMPGAIRGVTWLVIGIPIWTFLWTYGALQLGLDRLGREHLVPDAPRVDPYLGLRPLGGVAFMGLWMLMAWLVPVFLTGLPDLVGVAVGSLVLICGLGAFFLSLARLHRQMAEVKASELATARDLYAQAYEPLRAAPSLETLERQRSLLAAAESLEKRAQAIHEWPIDEGTLARVITIATSVVAMMVARLILDPLGL